VSIDSSLPLVALRNLLAELMEGPSDSGAWVLGRGDLGLGDVLQGVSSQIASQRPATARNTIAAHAGHVKYGLELLNRWASGEENPFADADWPGSWRGQVVSEAEWSRLIVGLRTESLAWIAALKEPRDWAEQCRSRVHSALFRAIRYHLFSNDNRPGIHAGFSDVSPASPHSIRRPWRRMEWRNWRKSRPQEPGMNAGPIMQGMECIR
jgi:hypothetical protein